MRILLAILLGVSGCEYTCVEGETACRGSGIASCGRRGFHAVSFCCAQDGCRDVVVDGLRQAVCSPVAEPDPRCDGAAPIDNICVAGPARLHCDHGFGGFEESCAGACVEPEPGLAICALAETADARCAIVGDGRQCFGNTIIKCAFGFAVSEQTCAAPFAACVLVPDNLDGQHPACATATTDPGCETDSPGRCDGLDIVGCRGGRRTIEHCEHSCYENPIDSMFPEAFCERPACSIED